MAPNLSRCINLFSSHPRCCPSRLSGRDFLEKKMSTTPMIPGEMVVAPGEIEINVGRAVIKVLVANTGDRPVQIGSHYHFA
jgi:hypothetical protein